MYPVLFAIGKFKLYSFGTFIAIGALVAGLFLFYSARNRKLNTHHLFDATLYTVFFSLIGARFLFYFLYQNQFQSFWQIFYFWQGGLVALGGLIVGFLTYLYFIRREKDPMWKMLDIGALALLLGWAIGKFGCHLSGCTVGRDAVNVFSVSGSYPVDLYSAIWAIAAFVILWLAWRRNKLSDGVIFFLSLEGLFLGELLIKTLKSDYGDGLVRVEAIVHLVLIVAVYLLFWRLHGPRIEKNRLTNIRNFVFRKWRKG
jgi:phosphatidylglycerol:prolipoprotein diacylglycerol transferase